MFGFFKEKSGKKAEEKAEEKLPTFRIKIAELEQKITKYELLKEDFANNYLPIRDKCIEVIRKHGLGRYPLEKTFEVMIHDNKMEFKVYDIEEDYWNEKRTLFQGEVLLDETIQLNTLKLLDTNKDEFCLTSDFGEVWDKVRELEDPTEIFEVKILKLDYCIKKIRGNVVETLENKI